MTDKGQVTTSSAAEIRVRVPRIAAGLVSNLVGLLGLIGVALAVGGLTGNWWWSLLTGSVFATVLAYIAQTHQQAAEQPAEPVTAAATARPRVVAEAGSA